MFEFITSSHPDDTKSVANQKRIREHAIRKGLKESKKEHARKERRDQSSNHSASLQHKYAASSLVTRLRSGSIMDPFQSLCECPDRLAMLLRHPLICRAGEPVFRVADFGKVQFQGMKLLDWGTWADPLLFHALSIAATLAINFNRLNPETLRHRGLLLGELNTAIRDRERRSSTSIAAALLVLIGSEYRTEDADRKAVEWHLRGMHAFIDMDAASAFSPNTELLQRALFWQDLISCLTIGTPRLLSHMTPIDCQHLRRALCSDGSPSLCGFRLPVLTCTPGFFSVLGDIRKLCSIVDAHCGGGQCSVSTDCEVQLMAELDDEGYPINNAQANLESRVVDLLSASRSRSSSNDILYQACLYATYLCTYKLSTGIWEGQFVPEICASRILECVAAFVCEEHLGPGANLLFWLLFVSGGMTERHDIRLRAIGLMRHRYLEPCRKLLQTWESVTQELKAFIWCRAAMDARLFRMWAQLIGND